MNYLGKPINFGSQKRCFYIYLTFLIVLPVALMNYTFFNVDSTENSILTIRVMAFYLILSSLMIFQVLHFMQYFFFLANIRHRFKQINMFLVYVTIWRLVGHGQDFHSIIACCFFMNSCSEHFLNCYNKKVMLVRSARYAHSNEMLVRQISAMYDTLIDTIEIFNKCYSFTVKETQSLSIIRRIPKAFSISKVMFYFGAGFIMTIMSIYSIYSSIRDYQLNDKEAHILSNKILWALFSMATTFLTIYISTSMANEVKRRPKVPS